MLHSPDDMGIDFTTMGTTTITTGHRTRIDIGIEVCWLLALALVPLAFNGRDVVLLFLQPKDFLLHLAALLILTLWSIEWALGEYRLGVNSGSWKSSINWPGRNPRNWALVAVVGFGTTAVISTILSPMPSVSLWGRDFATLGYELYSILSFLVIFFAIALRVRDPEQVRRIFWVVVGAGSLVGLYGVSQRFGWDPVGNAAGDARSIASFGNPIFFGSNLVMTIVITFALVLDNAGRNNRWWLALIATFMAIQLASLWFTGSRGPWLGVVFGIGSFALLGPIFLTRSQIVRGGSVLVVAVLTVVLLANLVPSSNDGQTRGLTSLVPGVSPIGGQVGGRSDIWRASVRLLDSWENPNEEEGMDSTLRPIFGLGPEMYFYSFPLVADPQSGTVVVSHAHDWVLQLLLELGFLGFLTFVSLAVSVLITGFLFIWDCRRGKDQDLQWLSIAMLTLIAALIGRAVEQSVGVARIADLLLFWALLGVVLAIPGMKQRTGFVFRNNIRLGSGYFRLAMASLVVFVALAIFIARDVQMMRAGLIAGSGFAAAEAGDTAEAIRLFERASLIAPDVQYYGVHAGELLVQQAQSQISNEAALASLTAARGTFMSYEERDPLAFITQSRILGTEAEMVNRGDPGPRKDLVDRALRLADSMPAYPTIQAIASEQVLIAGQVELGLELANRAIDMEAQTSPQPLAWLQRGQALGELGDASTALESFTIGLSRDPNGPLAAGFHRNIAMAYEDLGDSMMAAEHRALANEIDDTQQSNER